jgi:hypothetical protein
MRVCSSTQSRLWRALARCTASVLLLLLLLALPAAHAHKASDGYLQLSESAQPGATRLALSLALKDIDAAVESLDADNDRQVTRGEINRAVPAVVRWVNSGAVFRCGSDNITLDWQLESLERRIDGAYVRLAANAVCAGPALGLAYSLMKDIDPTHRLIVSGQLDGQALAKVLSPQGRGDATLRLARTPGAPGSPGTPGAAGQPAAATQSGPATLAQFFAEGVHHIVTGYDHLAFLLALMLPIVLYRRSPLLPGEPPLNAGKRRGILALFMTVTGFTIGHSLTLVLATLGVISASPVWVEPAIAITIALSALLNLFPLRHVRGDALALCFGMIHGLAFSSVMTEAGISGALLLWGLAGFNLGVEAGQLAGVAVWCCIHLALVRWKHYERVVVRGGSWALLMLALYWAAQRVGVL